ncbi:permease [Candidatus Saganbacteria bacterium CG08_land_8_20_14_0_20_45_16]|uniref:Permease n=1 Tax=Candidatus Saganbacteria bacterium CG08_land_8_20_14_0_20_45_16 TaxID=2014293 RepID=A0A2H0XT60_UNCSA|nr:MAG: permease [Candidatus Saganbacteria bacterium CG08_land_8_20_14_0_20_45_16]
MIKIIDRYIFKELFEPFLFGLGAFTAILSASMIMFELVRAVVLKGMPLIVALQVFIYRLPGIVVYIFPMAMLLAALLAFSRLSGESEIIAFRASGISLYRLIIPVLVLGLLVSLVNLAFSEIVVPEANLAAKNLLLETSTQYTPKLQKNVFVPEIEHGQLKRIFYAQVLKGNTMQDVIVQEFNNGQLQQIITAQAAVWQAAQNEWLFKSGIIYLLAETGEYKHLIKFKEQALAIKYSPSDFLIGDKNPDEMTMAQLRDFIKLKEKMGEETTDIKLQLNLKMAIPFASLVFALLGAPLGIARRRASSSIGLGLSILVIFFYYIVTFICMAIGELNLFSPAIAAWLPNFITAGVGWYILSQKAIG